MPNGEWRLHAACRGIANPEIFFPISHKETSCPKATRTAKRICRTCQVKTNCLAEAMTNPDIEGIWGGLTTAERRKKDDTTSGN